MNDAAEEERPFAVDRGAPLIATAPRWAALVAGQVAVLVGLAWAYVAFTHSQRTLSSFAGFIAGVATIPAVVTFALLRAEESRVARELRTARAGTAVIRGMVLQRRQRVPLFLRLFSTAIGTAAVMLADGERTAALDLLSSSSPLMDGGRLRLLRQYVDADAQRATGTSAALERSIQTLRALPRTGNREADRYRTHVLVKAVLEQGNDAIAESLAEELAGSSDDEERLYTVWLRAWFDLEDEPSASEGQLRLALLLARSHGAEDLVKKLEAAVEAIGSPEAPPPDAA
jgi:hypothetical protein